MFVEMTTPLAELGFDAERALPAETRMEFERTASIDAQQDSLVRVTGDDRGEWLATLRRNRLLKNIETVYENEDETVYRMSANGDQPRLLRLIGREEGTILSAIAVDDRVSFEVQFPDHAAATRFYAAYTDRESSISIGRSTENGRTRHDAETRITPKQAEALELALASGYYEIPRRTSLSDLADELGVTDNAVSERLRRGTATLVRNWLPTD